jgi:hypothetical protein
VARIVVARVLRSRGTTGVCRPIMFVSPAEVRYKRLESGGWPAVDRAGWSDGRRGPRLIHYATLAAISAQEAAKSESA